MAIIQSSPIDIAAKSERNWLFFLVGWIVISALVSGFITALLYKKTGKYQQLVQSEANARISESNAEAKRAAESAGLANERAGIANASAAKANERAEKLESDNLTLRGQVATLETAAVEAKKDVAGLQKAAADALAEQQRVQIQLAEQQGRTAGLEKAASDAKASQQRVEIELAKQEARATNAESALDAISKVLAPRVLWFNFNKFSESLQGKMKSTVVILYQKDDNDARAFAIRLFTTLQAAGWQGNPAEPYAVYEEYGESSGSSLGVTVVSNSPPKYDFKWDLNTPYGVLMNAFQEAGGGANGWQSEKFPEVVKLVVNRRTP